MFCQKTWFVCRCPLKTYICRSSDFAVRVRGRERGGDAQGGGRSPPKWNFQISGKLPKSQQGLWQTKIYIFMNLHQNWLERSGREELIGNSLLICFPFRICELGLYEPGWLFWLPDILGLNTLNIMRSNSKKWPK